MGARRTSDFPLRPGSTPLLWRVGPARLALAKWTKDCWVQQKPWTFGICPTTNAGHLILQRFDLSSVLFIQPTCWETYYTHTLVIRCYKYIQYMYIQYIQFCPKMVDAQNIELNRVSHCNLFIGFWAPWFWQLLWWWQTKHRPVNKLAVKRQNERSSQSVLNNLQHGNAPGRKTWNLPDFQNLCRCVAIRSQSNWSARSVCSKGWYNTCKQFNQRWTAWILYGSRQVPDLDIYHIYIYK